jgi:hypothetical protein
MSARNYLQTLGAGEVATLPGGRFFMIKAATAVLNVETIGNAGSPVSFTGIGAGSKFGPVAEGEGWTNLKLTAATAQNIEVIISDDGYFDVANTVTVSGSVTVTDVPSTALTDRVDATNAIATEATIAANLSRRRITIGVLSSSNNSVRVSQAGGTGRGIEISPGTNQEFKTTGALVVRNDNTTGSGAAATWYAEEE